MLKTVGIEAAVHPLLPLGEGGGRSPPDEGTLTPSPSPVGEGRVSLDKPLTIAILAMGGQGGGVLADWIVEVAEHEGWAAQSTSVPGVAQRTGATIYYIETLPPRNGVAPVFSLMPTPGDVDVVMAAELMEAGRSVLRGLVTPDKTTLIASTHRAYAVVEKEKPGDGAGDPFVVVDALDFAARRTIAFDMEKLAVERGTVISAPMLGALAGSGALPFERSAYEAVVREGARGANASLAAFADAYDRAREGKREAPQTAPAKRLDDLPEDAGHPELNRLVGRLSAELPESARLLAFAGLKRIVDFQDVAYGDEYIDRLRKLTALDAANGGETKNFAFTAEAAKRLAVAMAYDDVIRVADIKLRPSRFTRLREEAGAAPDQLVYATEYLHPRGEEICGMMPASLGAFIEAKPFLFRMLDRIVNRGRRVPVGRIGGFLQLYCVAALKPTRRLSLRHKRETEHRETWLAQAADILPKNYDLAVEILRCRRLVKGYSDTHARGVSKFDRAMAKAPKLVSREDGAQWMARLIAAALIDEPGEALDGVAKTIDTL